MEDHFYDSLQLVEWYHALELASFEGEIVWYITKPDGQPRRSLDTSRAKERFGFQAKTDFHESPKRTIDWHIEHRRKLNPDL